MKTLIAPLLVAVAALTPSAEAADADPAALVDVLRGGGHVVYIRHASTESDYADQVEAEIGDCASQRTLSEAGWDEAETIGAALDLLGVPVGAVYSSEYCRAWQTARIAFGKPIKDAGLNFPAAEDYSAEDLATMKAAVTPYLTEAPLRGHNTIVVGHDDPFEAATGIYPEPQGVAYVVRPDGETFEVLGAIAPGDWAGLLAAR